MKDTEDAHFGLISYIHNYEGKMWYSKLSMFYGAPSLNSRHRVFLEDIHHRCESVIGSNGDQSTFYQEIIQRIRSTGF